MFTNKKSFWIILLTLVGFIWAFSMPVGALEEGERGAKIGKVKFNDNQSNKSIVTDLIDFITPVDPLACQEIDGVEVCQEMYPAEAAWICEGNPDGDPANPDAKCREVLSSTLGAAWNTWVCWGGRWFYIAP